MKYCSKCGKEIVDDAVICVHCGCSVEGVRKAEKDETNVGLCVLSFFIPLFGIIYWALQYKETPKKAKACGITAIVSWAVSFVLSIVAVAFYTFIIMGALSQIP